MSGIRLNQGQNGPLLASRLTQGRHYQGVDAGRYDLFGNLMVAERTSIINLISNYGLSDLRDRQEVEGTGVIDANNSALRIQTGEGGTGLARLSTRRRGVYQAGMSAEAGIGFRLNDEPAGDQEARWGYFSVNDGAFYHQDANGLRMKIMRAGTITQTVERASWSGDKLDGQGPSGFEYDVANPTGLVWQILFNYYGFGEISFWVSVPWGDSHSAPTMCHMLTPDKSTTSFGEPNLPVAAEVSNNGAESNLTAQVTGRNFSVLGRFDPPVRLGSHRRIEQTLGGSFAPVISYRHKTGRQNVTIQIAGMEGISSGDVIFEQRVGGELTGASFGAPENTPPAETAVEVDTSATAITGGIKVASGFAARQSVTGQARAVNDINVPNLEVGVGEIVTLVARSISGTPTLTAQVHWQELW